MQLCNDMSICPPFHLAKRPVHDGSIAPPFSRTYRRAAHPVNRYLWDAVESDHEGSFRGAEMQVRPRLQRDGPPRPR